MSTWQIALVREQGVNFGVVVVKDHVLDNKTESDELCHSWAHRLGCPIALMGAHRHRTYGRQDIVRWLSSIHPARLPWREVTV